MIFAPGFLDYKYKSYKIVINYDYERKGKSKKLIVFLM